MNTDVRNNFVAQFALVFAGTPLLIWAMGGLSGRTLLKESLSILTLLAFCQMTGLFFWTRINTYAAKGLKMVRLIRWHKTIGYTCIAVMFFHPVFLVAPRFFESGVAPGNALITILTTFHQGVVLGIIAWGLMLALGITSFFRNRLPMTYKTWRTFHGILATLFITTAAWHVIDLGRHSSLAMSVLVILLTTAGIRLFGKHHIFKKSKAARRDR